MIDESTRLAIPAITLGFKVSNDTCGRFLFENDEYSIYYRDNLWHMTDSTGACYQYYELMAALQDSAIDEDS